MRISAFETLEAVLRLGSFAAAAKEVNLTPSAVSMQMKQLEQYFGLTLFDRSGLQIRPNSIAHEIADMMRAPLHQLQTLRCSSSIRVEGTLRVGIIESMQAQVLPNALSWLHDQHPKLLLKPSRGRSSTLISAVKAGKLDAALVAQPLEIGVEVLAWEKILRRELVMVAPPDSTTSSVLTLFRRYGWIRYKRNTVTEILASQFVQKHIGKFRSTMELDSAIAILAVVSAGLGVAIIQPPDPVQKLSYPVRIVRLGRQAPELQLSLVTRKADSDRRTLHALRDAICATLIQNNNA